MNAAKEKLDNIRISNENYSSSEVDDDDVHEVPENVENENDNENENENNNENDNIEQLEDEQ